MNFIQLVGKITEQPVKINSKTTSSHSDMKLAVHSNFREFNGHYRIDELNFGKALAIKFVRAMNLIVWLRSKVALKLKIQLM